MKIYLYNFELYRFKVCTFVSETQCNAVQLSYALLMALSNISSNVMTVCWTSCITVTFQVVRGRPHLCFSSGSQLKAFCAYLSSAIFMTWPSVRLVKLIVTVWCVRDWMLLCSTIAWNLITSYYDDLPYADASLMKANQPWSGYYEVGPPIWAAGTYIPDICYYYCLFIFFFIPSVLSHQLFDVRTVVSPQIPPQMIQSLWLFWKSLTYIFSSKVGR